MLSKAKSNQSLNISFQNEKTRLNEEEHEPEPDLHRNESTFARKLANKGFQKERIFELKFMVPLLIFESIFFLIELLYFLFADQLDTAMIAFYGFEAISLFIFIGIAIVLLIFFLGKDKFLISEIVLSGVLILTDCIIIAMHAAIRDHVHIFLYICIGFAGALRVVVIYFGVE